MSLGEQWEMGHQLAYMNGSDMSAAKLSTDQYSAVVRPMYKWNDTMRTVFEAGYHGGKKAAGTETEDFGHAK
ncbi:carbohydrate porin, partial [Bacillus cereus group sp. Bce025]